MHHPKTRKRAKTTFESIDDDAIIGKLTLPDRIIFKGHTSLADVHNFRVFLSRQGILLKDFKGYAPKVASQLKQHAQKVAAEAARPYIYLDSPHTARDHESKEQLARNIAKRDGVSQGLICVLGVVEPCRSFKVRGNHRTHKLELVSAPRKCLNFYFYFMDPEFGFMHIRLQSWFPLQIQVYINGREWLCRQLDQQGIGYRRYDNALLQIDDLPLAQRLCRRLARKKWLGWLDRLAHLVNPWLRKLERQGFAGYRWVTHQCELAPDVMFRSRAHLRAPQFRSSGKLSLDPEA